ncbi:hypothetical protein ACQW02_13890 [Humitalea sp. 24SJ18S-53]|uniref:hypothetical protein n=1 Tax=Humitalea sp. 24SJ18S-53 TaxID=3422307 RepID=UPI003D66C1F4
MTFPDRSTDHSPLAPLPPPASPVAIGAGALLLIAAFGTTGIIAFVQVIIGMFR